MPKQKKEPLPFNPAILQWARVRAGLSIEEAAHSLNVKESKIEDWEDTSGEVRPTVVQGRRLADIYDRPFLEFFRNQLPEVPEPTLIPDYRLYQAADDPSETQQLKNIQSWAEAQRINALDLYSELGEQPKTFPADLIATVRNNPEETARQARAALNFPIEHQLNLKASERIKLPNIIREKIESLGVLVLKRSDLKKHGIRGFCIVTFPLPIIAFGGEASTAQAFTLGHEFGHVLLRQSAISGSMTRRGGGHHERVVEEWCNAFSAAFLMPQESITHRIALPDRPAAEFSDAQLNEIAQMFNVSPHAMLIRLMGLGYVEADYYWNIKRPQFLKEEAELKSFGRAKYYGTRYRGALGDLYTGLVLEAWSSGKITNHNAAEYMGIKNIEHLNDIRKNFEV